jgi:hypothetical protein
MVFQLTLSQQGSAPLPSITGAVNVLGTRILSPGIGFDANIIELRADINNKVTIFFILDFLLQE